MVGDALTIGQGYTFQRGRRLIEIIIDHAHQTIGHYGQWKTSNYIRWSYWWPQMATDIEAFCRSCRKCQTNKTDMQKPQGFLHSLPIPDKLWQSVGMDFMGPLPWSQGNDYLLVIIDQLTLQVHLVPTMTQVTAKEVSWLFLKEVMRLHGVVGLFPFISSILATVQVVLSSVAYDP